MSIRTDRVGRMIQREVADLLQQDFGEATHSLVTVTNVRMTDDLSIAYVDVSVLGGTPQERQAGFERLEGQTTEVRHALAQRIRHDVRRVPEVKFFLDEGPQQVARMDELFAQIAAERGDRPAPPSGDGDEGGAAGRGDY